MPTPGSTSTRNQKKRKPSSPAAYQPPLADPDPLITNQEWEQTFWQSTLNQAEGVVRSLSLTQFILKLGANRTERTSRAHVLQGDDDDDVKDEVDQFKHQSLPLARIKKVMRLDEDVGMIANEVTILLEKACQSSSLSLSFSSFSSVVAETDSNYVVVFIQEITCRAHTVALASKRRTIAKTDVATAVQSSSTFDFLIDIVPRSGGTEEAEEGTGGESVGGKGKKLTTKANGKPRKIPKRSGGHGNS